MDEAKILLSVEEFLRKNPRASRELVESYAKTHFTEKSEVMSFLRLWSLKTVGERVLQQSFANDVSRIWPEEKGY